MKTQIEKLPHSRVALEIEVDAPRVEEAVERAYRRVVKRLDIPGFRRGKAPRFIVERRIGWEALLEEALDELLPQVYWEAVRATDIKPVDDPVFDVEEAQRGQPLRVKAEVDVRPEVGLANYRGLEAEKVIRRVQDEDVERILKAYQERYAQLVVPERDVVENGDFVVIDYEGFIEGQPFQGGAARGHMLEVGSGAFIPGFEEQLVGMTLGETRDVKVTMPTENVPEALQGKEALFKVTLKEIKVKQVPAIDDELAKEVGEADTLEEWKEKLRATLEERAQADARARLRDALVEQVAEASSIDLPESLVARTTRRLVEEFAFYLYQRGLSLEDYLRHSNKSLDDVFQEFRPRAERRVRMGLVIDAIAQQEQLSVSREEIEAEWEKMYPDAPSAGEEGEGRPSLSPEAESAEKQDLERLLLTRKVLDLLEQEAKVTERWVDSLEEESEP